jgi:hypothetical protein
MRPEDEALLARVKESRKEAVREALEETQRIREDYGDVREDELPSEVRERVSRAHRLVERETTGGFAWWGLIAGLLLIGVATLVALVSPGVFYAFAPGGEGRARCVVRERALGLLSVRSEVFPAVESAEGSSTVEQQEIKDTSGRRKSQRVPVRTLRLLARNGPTLDERTVQFPIGMVPEEVAPLVASLARGETRGPVVRWIQSWLALLVATLFGYVGFEIGWQTLRDSARLSDAAALRYVFGQAVTVPLRLGLLATLIAAWVVAFLGGDPPDRLVSLLGVGP